jgi:YidC/Oxa1 family membrane protein insertase
MPEQKNLILAIIFSIAILVGFQFLVEQPEPPAEDAAQTGEAIQAGETAGGGQAGDAAGLPSIDEVGGDGLALGPGDALGEGTSREAALEQSGPRVQIETPRLHGSISLHSGRIDDLTLVDYRETLDPESAEIELLSPRSSPDPYYATFSWQASGDMPVPTGDTQWTADREVLTPGEPVTLTWDNGRGLVFERVISVDEDYMFTVTQRVTNTGDEPVTLAPYGRILRFGTPEVIGFFILHEGPYGVFDGTLEEYDYGDIEDEGLIEYDTTGGWLGITDKYWMVGLIPDQSVPVDARFSYGEPGPASERYGATLIAPARDLAAGETTEATTRLFAGAKEVELIDSYAEQFGIENFDLAIDFGWFYFLTKPFFYALIYINAVVGNFGVAILIFTVFIKLIFFPLANKSYRAMSKMKALQPEMMQLRERYSDDKQKMQQELMALYKREKVNPASGCLPILIQIPVFFALYKVLFVTIEMRHAPFIGWIQDLSVKDPTSIFNLFGLLPFDVPDFLTIGVLPLIMGVTMYLQMKMNPPPTDPMQQKIFMALPFVFTVMLAQFPAGLVLYWTWNNLLSILQQYVIMRRMGVKIGGGMAPTPAGAAAAHVGPAPSGKGGGEAAKSGEKAGGAKPSGKPARAQAKGGAQGKAVWQPAQAQSTDGNGDGDGEGAEDAAAGESQATSPQQTGPVRPKKATQSRPAQRKRSGGRRRRG